MTMNPILILSFAIATIIPVLALGLIRWLDFYKTGQFLSILLCFGAGAIAVWFASQANSTTIKMGWVERINVIRYSAPILEEILKGLILLYIVSRADFTYFVEGAIYGFAAGIGFAIVENYQYVLGAGDASLALAASRVISTNLIHATTSSLLGVVLGLFSTETKLWRKLIPILLGLLIAMAIHMGYNNLVTRADRSLLLIYAASSGIIGAGLIAWLIRWGIGREGKTRLKDLDMRDRVTGSESRLVNKMESVDKLLEPVKEKFGAKKAEQVKDFLLKQARMGFIRKNLEKAADPAKKEEIQKELDKIKVDVDKARIQVGSYAMLYVRALFPDNGEGVLWGRLQASIEERAAAPRPAGGMNLWANLKTRQDEQKNQAAKPKQENEQ